MTVHPAHGHHLTLLLPLHLLSQTHFHHLRTQPARQVTLILLVSQQVQMDPLPTQVAAYILQVPAEMAAMATVVETEAVTLVVIYPESKPSRWVPCSEP